LTPAAFLWGEGAVAPALTQLLAGLQDTIKGSGDLVPTLERSSVPRDLPLALTQVRPPFRHELGVLPVPLSLELVAVFSEPGFAPGRGAASRWDAGFAVTARPALAPVDEFPAAGCAVRAHQPTRARFDF